MPADFTRLDKADDFLAAVSRAVFRLPKPGTAVTRRRSVSLMVRAAGHVQSEATRLVVTGQVSSREVVTARLREHGSARLDRALGRAVR